MSHEPVYDELELDVRATSNDPKAQARIDASYAKDHKANRDQADPKQNNRTILSSKYVGKYEKASEAEVPAELHLGNRIMVEAGDKLPRMQNAHNNMLPELRSTLRAMGRLKDLDNAGAKLDPAQLKADPALAKKFSALPDVGAADTREKFDNWSDAATDEHIDHASVVAGRQQLRAAVTGFTGAQYKLQARSKAAQLEGKKSEKAEIDQKIATLHKIVDTVEMAVSVATSVETMMMSTRDVKDLDAIENKENLAHTQSTTQKVTEGAVKAAEFLKAHSGDVKKWVNGAGFTLDNILMIGTGDFKRYGELMDAIKKLQGEIAELGFDAETKEIEAAAQQLDGMKMEVGVRTRKLKKSQESARAGAHNFGDKVAGSDGTMAMYAAQAYQDLAFFGGDVQRHRAQSIDPRLDWLYNFLDNKNNNLRAEALGYVDDMRTAAHFQVDQAEQREFFTSHVPQWKAKAKAWDVFFTEMTGGTLARK